MKSKIMKKLLTFALIMAISIPMISYAVNLEAEKLFLICDKKEVVKGEKVILTLDLSVIQYENFEFTLTSNTDIENVTTQQENIEVTNNTDSFKITANKSELNIEQIDLYYQIPEDIEVGTKIELTGIVKENNNGSKAENENTTNNTMEDSQIQEVTIALTVIKEKESSENQDNSQNKEENKMPEISTEKEQNISNKASNMQINQTQSNAIKSVSNSTLGGQETNTYKGESNNYLSTLDITNFNINPQFSKTNTTYFVEVESSISDININAQAEDENATVNIYGNNDLQDGENKVLISVTAENGDVKTYRIYITRK